jgi:hypothetical protein
VHQLRGHAPDEGVIDALVQASNALAIVSLFIHLEVGAEERRWRKVFDREANSLRGLGKPSIPERPIPGSPASARKQLCFGTVIKIAHAYALRPALGSRFAADAVALEIAFAGAFAL